MKNRIENFLEEIKSQTDLLTALSVYISIKFRNLLVQNEFFYSDFTEICDLKIAQDVQHQIGREYFKETFSAFLENSFFQIEISDVKKLDLEHDSPVTIIFRVDVGSIFDGYEEGYMLPFYTMLHFKTTFESADNFYEFINSTSLTLEYCELNGFALIRKANKEKLGDFANQVRNEIVMCLLNN